MMQWLTLGDDNKWQFYQAVWSRDELINLSINIVRSNVSSVFNCIRIERVCLIIISSLSHDIKNYID